MFILPDEFELPAVSIETFLEMRTPFYPKFRREVFDECLRAFEVEDNVALKSLSLGQKKKVLISFALALGVKYLLLDEPTNGLDIPSKAQFRKLVAGLVTEEQAVIISTHQVHDVDSLLDHVLIIGSDHAMLDVSIAEMTADVIYSQPSLQGNATIVKRSKEMEETPVNIELFFNAVTKGLIKNEEEAL